MKSNDYISGYVDGVSAVMNKIKKIEMEMYKYANRKNFKGLSRRDVVFTCLEKIGENLKEFDKYRG